MSWFHPYGEYRAALAGRRDARRNIPSPDCDEPTGYLLSLKFNGETACQQIEKRWRDRDAAVMAELAAAAQTCRRDADLLDQMRKDYPEHHHDSGHGGWHWFALGFLMLIELPINSVVFRVFEEAEWANYLVGLGLGFVLVYLAHYAGTHLKISHIAKGKVADLARATAYKVIALIGLVILAVAGLRHYYLHTQGEPANWVTFFAFVAIQAAIAAAAVLISYAAVDPLRDQEARSHAHKLRSQRLIQTRIGIHQDAKDHAQTEIAAHLRSAGAYQRSNMCERDDGLTPPIFQGLPDKMALEVPGMLAEDLDWSACSDEVIRILPAKFRPAAGVPGADRGEAAHG